ncbi:MAG TPA: GNAT family N-acetyltransferase, partial [Hymenobacter sp.]
EYTTVLYKALTPGSESAAGNDRLQIRLAGPDDAEHWARTAAEGWRSESPELADFVFEFGKISTQRALSFLAEIDGRAVATGSLILHEDVALLTGASTVPDARGQGAQTALLHARLRYATEQGCTVATIGALPGSQSQRNAEKQGFRVAYTRTKWQLLR